MVAVAVTIAVTAALPLATASAHSRASAEAAAKRVAIREEGRPDESEDNQAWRARCRRTAARKWRCKVWAVFETHGCDGIVGLRERPRGRWATRYRYFECIP